MYIYIHINAPRGTIPASLGVRHFRSPMKTIATQWSIK